jgi:fermentation-respiration switch protein FrsA (DUF1100 family)
MIALLAGATALYGALVGALYLFQRDLLYLPDTSRPNIARAAVPGLNEVTLTTADGLRLLAWHVPAPAGRPTILYVHGNGGHIGYRADRAGALSAAGYGILLVGYRGYGGNPGSPSEDGFHDDAEAGLAFLTAQGVAPSRIVFYGESLGSAVAVRLAAETASRGAPAAALVLEAPFTSIADVAQHHYPYVPARQLVKDRFDAVSRIARVKAPLLVLHGERDRVVPVAFGRALFEAASEPKRGWFPGGADHATIFDRETFRVVTGFLAEHVR